jgi:hypothetical protein
MNQHPRGTICPSFAKSSSLERQRAQGVPVLERTRSLLCMGRKHRS